MGQKILPLVFLILLGVSAGTMMLTIFATFPTLERSSDKASYQNESPQIGELVYPEDGTVPVRVANESSFTYDSVFFKTDALAMGELPAGGPNLGSPLESCYAGSCGRWTLMRFGEDEYGIPHRGVDLMTTNQQLDFVPAYSTLQGTVVSSEASSNPDNNPGYGAHVTVRNKRAVCVARQDLWSTKADVLVDSETGTPQLYFEAATPTADANIAMGPVTSRQPIRTGSTRAIPPPGPEEQALIDQSTELQSAFSQEFIGMADFFFANPDIVKDPTRLATCQNCGPGNNACYVKINCPRSVYDDPAFPTAMCGAQICDANLQEFIAAVGDKCPNPSILTIRRRAEAPAGAARPYLEFVELPGWHGAGNLGARWSPDQEHLYYLHVGSFLLDGLQQEYFLRHGVPEVFDLQLRIDALREERVRRSRSQSITESARLAFASAFVGSANADEVDTPDYNYTTFALPKRGYGFVGNYQCDYAHLTENRIDEDCAVGDGVFPGTQCGTVGASGKDAEGNSIVEEPMIHYNCSINPRVEADPAELTAAKTVWEPLNVEELLSSEDPDPRRAIPTPCCTEPPQPPPLEVTLSEKARCEDPASQTRFSVKANYSDTGYLINVQNETGEEIRGAWQATLSCNDQQWSCEFDGALAPGETWSWQSSLHPTVCWEESGPAPTCGPEDAVTFELKAAQADTTPICSIAATLTPGEAGDKLTAAGQSQLDAWRSTYADALERHAYDCTYIPDMDPTGGTISTAGDLASLDTTQSCLAMGTVDLPDELDVTPFVSPPDDLLIKTESGAEIRPGTTVTAPPQAIMVAKSGTFTLPVGSATGEVGKLTHRGSVSLCTGLGFDDVIEFTTADDQHYYYAAGVGYIGSVGAEVTIHDFVTQVEHSGGKVEHGRVALGTLEITLYNDSDGDDNLENSEYRPDNLYADEVTMNLDDVGEITFSGGYYRRTMPYGTYGVTDLKAADPNDVFLPIFPFSSEVVYQNYMEISSSPIGKIEQAVRAR